MPGPWRLNWTKNLSCKSQKEQQVENAHTISRDSPASATSSTAAALSRSSGGCSRSLANLKDVIHGNTSSNNGRVVHKSASSSPEVAENVPSRSSLRQQHLLKKNKQRMGVSHELVSTNNSKPRIRNNSSNNSTSTRKFGSCNGCNVADEAFGAMIFHPSSAARASCKYTQPACQKCGEIFSKYDALEHHHSIRHAVTELGRGDSSRNIVEIIFRTSWLKREAACIVNIERILKVNNTTRTTARFEEYRDQVKARANVMPKKHPRCIADGNELLRFYSTTILCDLGLNGSSTACCAPGCSVCRIIRYGFSSMVSKGRAIHTAATSGRAHDCHSNEDGLRAMVVCRVVAGRMRRGFNNGDGSINVIESLSGFDSMAGDSGASNIDDLYVFSSKALLPCFVVVYRWK